MAANTSQITVTAKWKDNASKGIQKLEGNLGKFKNLLKSLIPVAAGFSVAMGVKMVADMARMAGETEGLRVAFDRLAESHGANATSILADLERIAQGTMSTSKIIRNANQAMLLGIPAEKLAKMTEIALAASKVTGQSVEYMMQSIALGVGRQSRMILDNLGIIVKQEEIYRKASERLGRELTDLEKKQAFLNATIESGEKIIKASGGGALSAAQKMQKLAASYENIKNAIGTLIASPVSAVFERVAKWVGAASDRLNEMAKTNLQRTIDQLKEMGAAAKIVASLTAHRAIIEGRQKVAELEGKIAKITEETARGTDALERSYEKLARTEEGRRSILEDIEVINRNILRATEEKGAAQVALANANSRREKALAEAALSRATFEQANLMMDLEAINNIVGREEERLRLLKEIALAETLIAQIKDGTWKAPSAPPAPPAPSAAIVDDFERLKKLDAELDSIFGTAAERQKRQTDALVEYINKSIQFGKDEKKPISDVVRFADALNGAIELFDPVLNFLRQIPNYAEKIGEPLERFKQKILVALEPLITEISKVLLPLLKVIGPILVRFIQDFVRVLKPFLRVLQIAAEVVLKFYDAVRWVANKIIGMFNAVIGLINKIPGINIKKIAYLEDAWDDLTRSVIGVTDEMNLLFQAQREAHERYVSMKYEADALALRSGYASMFRMAGGASYEIERLRGEMIRDAGTLREAELAELRNYGEMSPVVSAIQQQTQDLLSGSYRRRLPTQYALDADDPFGGRAGKIVAGTSAPQEFHAHITITGECPYSVSAMESAIEDSVRKGRIPSLLEFRE